MIATIQGKVAINLQRTFSTGYETKENCYC